MWYFSIGASRVSLILFSMVVIRLRPCAWVWVGPCLLAGSGRTFPQSRLNSAVIKSLFLASLAVRRLTMMPLRYHQSQGNAPHCYECVLMWALERGTHCLWSLPTESGIFNVMHLPVMKSPKQDQMMSLNSEWIRSIMFWSWLWSLHALGKLLPI